MTVYLTTEEFGFLTGLTKDEIHNRTVRRPSMDSITVRVDGRVWRLIPDYELQKYGPGKSIGL